MVPHPRGTAARVLLTSVFGPFSCDDEFGSRVLNPMELYQNQVTREQGPFSLRMFHRSWGLILIQHNIGAASTLLDFPTRERFVRELTTRHYDIVGISSILVREHSPDSVIVVGGHVAAIPEIEEMVDADYIVRGEGVRWFREYLGEDPEAPIDHPPIPSSFSFRVMGLPAPRGGGDASATIVPSVGCPMGCNFCTTSAFFGGKGKVVNFFQTGAELFEIMCRSEAALGVDSFFVMDENFLLYKQRALELLDLMKQHGKSWSLYTFSSANALAKYELRELVELGVNWVWLGLEGARSEYTKLRAADTRLLTRQLQDHGIHVLGSTIIGLEHHTPENIDDEIAHAVAHDTDCHQFMLYTPVPGTPLYWQMLEQGRMLPDTDLADIHGQHKFNFEHAAIPRDASKPFLDGAFRRDYAQNGPSLFRMARTMMKGWRRYRDDADPRVRARVAREAEKLRGGFGAALWTMEKYLRGSHPEVSERIRSLRLEVGRELGWRARLAQQSLGRVLLWTSRRETRRFPGGRRLEPRTFVDRHNWQRRLA
jgi:radical SAM superfamily enzyme YgiQ (UPF0313 family)